MATEAELARFSLTTTRFDWIDCKLLAADIDDERVGAEDGGAAADLDCDNMLIHRCACSLVSQVMR